nr:integrase, catalytic region, zinc finger, CCHC-type, peptidase aspartic, catalytic [Tanacetum cinerariifolium]
IEYCILGSAICFCVLVLLFEDIQCAGSDHDHYQEAACAHHENHMMHDSVQLDHVVDSHADYTSDSNIILYDQYVKDNEVPVVHSDVSSVPTDAFMMIYDDMCEPHDQSVSYPSRNTAVQNSLTAKLATYKEHVELYERRAKFELTKREQKINEQLRIVISGCNFKKESLKKELHSINLQLASTINHNKSIVEEVSFLKKDFKQRENKHLADFLDMKTLKEKVEDKLIKQDKSLQTVHMLCRPRPNSNELNRVAIGFKNPLCLTCAKQVQHALYNGHEIIKDNHTPAIGHNSEDTLEIAEITRKKMNDEMNDPECVTRKLKSEALKERTKVSRPIKAFIVVRSRGYAVDRKRDAIELKDLLIANDNLTAECLSQEVFCVATNSELNVARFTEMYIANTTAEARCLALEAELANLRDTNNHNNKKELINHFSKLEHYKELYDSIKITRAKHIEQVTKLTTKNVNLKTRVSKATVNPQVSARDKHAIDIEPIVPHLKNNRDAHLDYLRHLKESVETIYDIVEEAKVVRPRDRSIISACRYTKHSQKKPVTVAKPSDKSDSTTHQHVVTVKSQKTNVPVPPSTGVNSFPNASRSQSKSHVKSNRISPAKGVNKLPVEDQPRKNKSHLKTSNRADSSSRLKRTIINSNSDSMCQTCNKCLTSSNHDMWVPIGKRNCYLDLEKSQSNPIYKIAVDLLKNTNFFGAFTASSTIPSIYVQQFWDKILYDKRAGCYMCQLDEQWFVLTKETLKEALQITPVNNNQAFAAPLSIDGLIDFVNQLGYPKLVRNLSNVVTNDLFQPWRALLTIINLCLTGKTSGFERPRAHALQILWGVVTRTNIDYAERIWEEFTQSIHIFNEDKQNLSRHTSRKKRATLILIRSIQFTNLIIHHLQRRHRFHPRLDSLLHLPNEKPVLGYLKFSAKGTKREVFRMPIPGSLITVEIQQALYYREYLAKVDQHRRYLAGETGGVQDPPAPKPTQPARKPKTTAPKAPSRPSVSIPVRSA